jgi:hypothetical protein
MKWVKYVEYALFVAAIICFASLFFLPQMQYQGDMHPEIQWMMMFTYAIVGIGIVCALISPIKNLFSSPKAALKALIGLVVAAAVVFGCYTLASAEPVPNAAGGFFENAFDLKFTDTMIYLVYLIGGVSILAILAGEIRNAIK